MKISSCTLLSLYISHLNKSAGLLFLNKRESKYRGTKSGMFQSSLRAKMTFFLFSFCFWDESFSRKNGFAKEKGAREAYFGK